MLEIGIDECTIVLQSNRLTITDAEWGNDAEAIIDKFSEKANFENVFGMKQGEKKAINGYTKCYTYGEHSNNITICYHEKNSNKRMGICINIHAQALAYYLKKTNLQFYQFLQLVQDDNYYNDVFNPIESNNNTRSIHYTIRLSRIDLTADFINEKIDITDIYNRLNNKKIGIFDRHLGRTQDEYIYTDRKLEYRIFGIYDTVGTLYVGSNKSNASLRIYNKKSEVEKNKGHNLLKALSASDWIRYECTLRHKYAADFGFSLTNIQSDDEYASVIASVIVQKFRFCEIDKNNGNVEETDYTQALIDIINSDYKLKSTSTKNNELEHSIAYLINSSGLYNTCSKVKEIWGNSAVKDMFNYILHDLKSYEHNEDCEKWLKKSKNQYKDDYADFDRFFLSGVTPLLTAQKYNDYAEFANKKNELKEKKLLIESKEKARQAELWKKEQIKHEYIPVRTLDDCLQELLKSKQLSYNGYYAIQSQFSNLLITENKKKGGD